MVLGISFATQAQIVNIPDGFFKAKLIYLGVDTNSDGEIQISEATQVTSLDISNAQITSLEGIFSFTNLLSLDCSNNQLFNLNFQGFTNLQSLDCYNTQLTTLNVQGLTNLQYLRCNSNQLTNINVQGLTNLQNLTVGDNLISSLNVQNLVNLQELSCYNAQLTTLNLQGLTNLQIVHCDYNQISTLNVQGLNNLHTLTCEYNQLASLNIQSLTNLEYLYCTYNQLTSLNLQGFANLLDLRCSNNQITTLNIEDLVNIIYFECNYNQLIYLNIKNGITESILKFNFNPNLQYICADDQEVGIVQQKINDYYYTNCNVNSYCSFVPGGVFYTIQGNTKLDYNSNGCDILDIDFPNLNLSITDGTNSGTIISNTSGNYSIPVQAGNHTITPVLENPTYFNISPTSFIANFPTQSSPLLQDFCVTANGVHHDVEVVYVSTFPARPGFDANYSIIYKNKGNQVENGAITLDFNDAVLDLVSANPTTNNQQPSTLTWNYTNLQPLETRTINLVFNVNSPTETPAVNIGNQLNYVAFITPLTSDEYQNDNISNLKQIVVGSYDPNDKTCIEGTTVGPDMIGQYVHYVIRFENTGTYPAENVVVKDLIDLAKFDVATLIPLHSSHNFVARIAGNKVEFIFEGINLPFDDANNDGYVAFKIKTKSNLVVGNTFSNNANIYFDYNFPITTNTFTTTIAALKVTDFDFGTHFTLYPNPVKNVLNLQSKDNTKVNSIEIYNTLGQVVLAVPNAISSVDVSSLESGNYFVKVNADLGVSNTKFIKE